MFKSRVCEPSSELIESTTEKLLDMTRGTLGSSTACPTFDARRIAMTIEYIKHFELHKGNVVEIGDPGYAPAKIVWEHFPSASVTGTAVDLRSEPLPFPTATVHSLVCLEVLEHLSDVPYGQATTLSGVIYFLNEVYRVLRIGGRALITTPNAASIWIIQRALLQQPPWMYEWHFREFTSAELREIAESIGFTIISLECEFVWHLWDFSPIVSFISENGYSLNDRGDDIFLLIEKPSGTPRVNPLRMAIPR